MVLVIPPCSGVSVNTRTTRAHTPLLADDMFTTHKTLELQRLCVLVGVPTAAMAPEKISLHQIKMVRLRCCWSFFSFCVLLTD